ncbi:YHS domain-containing (seleno)protein [Synechococcus elongatus]|uniref:YHS domain-containing (Seleno)protein n=1 Tax=Synechococcus elongatus PCC 11801 TaxID=2219813 RepID=A0AAN1QPJ3_SYNEL|nr:YHS domain-containing (seleno)protein [Synechococcus elongatus]AZB72991.1 hypothetical protein DOP62_09890 [Synechococcus elongatus PCC 11801]
MKLSSLLICGLVGLASVGVINSLEAATSPQSVETSSRDSRLAQAATRFPAVYNENGIALDGQDVVAYFRANSLVQGSPKFTHTWNGVKWQFSSAMNRDLFAKNPTQYAPQYGGYCAKAAAGGVLATTIPNAWEIRDGKLYLNYSLEAQKEWKQDTATKIVKANANWPKILNNDTLKR